MCVLSKVRSVVSGTQSLTGSLTKGPSSRISGRNNVNFSKKKAHVTTLFLNSNRREGGPSHRPGGPRSAPVPSLKQRTDALCSGLDLILEHHDAKSNVREALKVQCHSYLDTSLTEQIWLKRCKYLLSYPLARFLKNPLPPAPDTTFQPSGVLRGWMKARLIAFNPCNVHLWYSWFQAKRSTLPLSDSIVNETYDTHFATLTKPDPGDDETIEEIFNVPIFQKLLNKLQFKIGRSFKDGLFNLEMPKTSACFESTRASGGQIKALRRISGITAADESYRNGITSPEFHSMVYRPWVFTRDGTKKDLNLSRYCAYGSHEWATLPTTAGRILPTVPLSCTIQAVLEPNKIRVISKGNALPYYTCKPLQLLIHGLMKKVPCFRLIGRPLTALDIHDIASHVPEDRALSSLYRWCSVDYSAATDGLSWKYSSRIFMTILGALPLDFLRNAFNVLGPHVLHYPNPDGKGATCRGIQTNGQLMGSILSFVILCLANLGVFLLAFTRAMQRPCHEKILEDLLINGDDMVYAYPETVYHQNVDIGRKVGLEMSVGKAYTHREYLNINSQSVLYPLHKNKVDRKLKWVNYLNTGLFFGRHKVQGKKDDSPKYAEAHGIVQGEVQEGITANLNCLLEGALPGKEHALLKKSLETHASKIKQECSALSFRKTKISRNLFIPKALGGMGILPPQGWKYYISKTDMFLAHGMLKKYNLPYSTERPLPGVPITDLDDWVTTPWEMRYDNKEEERFPLHQIDFTNLKRLCRSPSFEFYIPNRYCQVSKEKSRTDPPPRRYARTGVSSDKLDFKEFDDLLSAAIDTSPVNDFGQDDDSFIAHCLDNRQSQLNEHYSDNVPLSSDFDIPDDIRTDLLPFF